MVNVDWIPSLFSASGEKCSVGGGQDNDGFSTAAKQRKKARTCLLQKHNQQQFVDRKGGTGRINVFAKTQFA